MRGRRGSVVFPRISSDLRIRLYRASLVLIGDRLTERLRDIPRLGQWIDRSLGVLFIALGTRPALATRQA